MTDQFPVPQSDHVANFVSEAYEEGLLMVLTRNTFSMEYTTERVNVGLAAISHGHISSGAFRSRVICIICS